jgi:hypothetical protein
MPHTQKIIFFIAPEAYRACITGLFLEKQEGNRFAGVGLGSTASADAQPQRPDSA